MYHLARVYSITGRQMTVYSSHCMQQNNRLKISDVVSIAGHR